MSPFVFLGGTVGKSNWREPFTKRLMEAGVPADRIFNPVVPEWTAECQEAEDIAKRDSEHLLFYICDPEQGGNAISGYSLVEATMCLYDRPQSTVVVFDLSGITGHVLKSLIKCKRDLRARFPEGHIFSTADDAVAYFSQIIAGIRVKSRMGGFSS